MKKRILLIDDDLLLNKINEKALVAAGLVHELHIVHNGSHALDYLQHRLTKKYPLPEVIILDLHMPVMSGFEFIDHFNGMDFPGKQNIELVVFSASTNASDRKRVIEKGIHHFISKPYLLRNLTDILMRSKITHASP